MSAPVRSVCAALFALAALVTSASAEAPAANPGDTAPSWAYDLPNDLMSPFCPGRSLADCPSPDAASMRMWILVQAAAGRTREDVEAELFERYGEMIRSAPKAEGFGASAYWMPAAFFAGGGARGSRISDHSWCPVMSSAEHLLVFTTCTLDPDVREDCTVA